MPKIQKSDDEWREQLSEEQYRVLRKKGTEWPFEGKFVFHKESGDYRCAACNSLIFKSDSKYESTIPTLAGWPSFSEAEKGSVELKPDNSYGMVRTEVACANCGGHLGHLFDDESSPTGKHYCVSSVCFNFEPKKEKK